MNTRLHDALPIAGQKHNRYCGPAALAALTGISTGEAAARIRDYSGKHAVRGTAQRHMVSVLLDFGITVTATETYYPAKRMTLRHWIETHYTGGRCLISAGNHYWAIDNGFYVDSIYQTPNPVSEIHMPRAQVCTVLHLSAD